MSQYPPMPGNEPLAYSTPGRRSSGLAITSMVLGIASIPLMCAWGLGLLLGITAIILGIIAMVSISKDPLTSGGKGMAIAGICTGAGSFVLFVGLLALLIPSLGKARELSNRAVCAANVRGITQSMLIYAADNANSYPLVSVKGGYALGAGGVGTQLPDPDLTIESMYKAPTPSVTQNMWLLALDGQVSPKQFLCKSDPAATVISPTVVGASYQINFNDGRGPSDFGYSYSYVYPWTETGDVGDWWKNAADASLPLISDLAPMPGTGSPAAAPAGIGKAANSFTHQRDGQNVGFGDGHADFERVPNMGPNGDNIFTTNRGTPSPTGSPFPGGAVPAIGKGGSAGAHDVVMVPVVDAGANYMRK